MSEENDKPQPFRCSGADHKTPVGKMIELVKGKIKKTTLARILLAASDSNAAILLKNSTHSAERLTWQESTSQIAPGSTISITARMKVPPKKCSGRNASSFSKESGDSRLS